MERIEVLPARTWNPDVRAGLNDLIANPPGAQPAIAVLDWDDTVIAGDVSLALLNSVDRATGTTHHDEYFRLLAAHGRAVAYPQITQWFAGHTRESFHALAETMLDESLEKGVVAWRPEMVDLIGAMHQAGWEVWVVSASPSVVVSAMAARVGIPGSRVLAMALQTGADGRFTTEVVQPATFCEGKLEAVKLHIGRPPTFCAGDSRSDADMMGYSLSALLIDGHDVDLRAEAIARGWWRQAGWHHTAAEPGVRVSSA